MNARPVVTIVSQATRLIGSCASSVSSTASEIWSAILSGWPSVTDSEVKRCLPVLAMERLSNISGPRVELVVDLAQPFAADVRVDLRGRDVRVAEHRLQRAQVRPALEQVRRERVAQHVRREHALDAGRDRVAPH